MGGWLVRIGEGGGQERRVGSKSQDVVKFLAIFLGPYISEAESLLILGLWGECVCA